MQQNLKNQAAIKLQFLKPSFLELDDDWQNILCDCCLDDLISIDKQLIQYSLQNEIIYPPSPLIFKALERTSFSSLKVVILGQDPYHGEGEANGLAFSVNQGVRLPPSLRNIIKELELEYPTIEPKSLNGTKLIDWAKEGVFLLNSSLTVIKDRANSLANIGWNQLTDKLVKYVSDNKLNVVFMLWGSFAIQKQYLIDNNKHLILKAPHPSPLSAHRGFLGCNHFRLANEYLVKSNQTPISWI